MKNSILYLFLGSKQFKNGNKLLALVYFLITAFGYISGFFPGLFIHILYLFFSYRKSFGLVLEVDQMSSTIEFLSRFQVLARCWGMVRLRVSPLFLRLSFMIFRSTVHNVERYKAQKRTN